MDIVILAKDQIRMDKMIKYINADKLICAIDGAESLDTERDYDEVSRFIEEAEAADVEEVRHGEWLPLIQRKHWADTGIISTNIIGFRCSLCGAEEKFKYKYCHCGAKMDTEKEE